MKTPEALVSALECGIIQEVIRPLMSGKEAQIYVVAVAGEQCVAKVYKEASRRSFKHRSQYAEGRRTRNSRDQRAINKRSRHGRSKDEAGWRSTEVDMIWRLRDAGVRVPEPINFVDGVLVMELVKDGDGNPAPRLGDLRFEAPEAREIHRQLLRQVARMLCAGVIHGDLSEFNVLMGAGGPVLIDFPQALEAARNQNARRFLLRDVENLHRFAARFSPGLRRRPYGEEMWSLYEGNRLDPQTQLSGSYQAPGGKANTAEVLALIDDATREEQTRRGSRDDALEEEPPLIGTPKPMRIVVDFTQEAKPRPKSPKNPKSSKSPKRARRPKSASASGRGRNQERRRPQSKLAAPSKSTSAPAEAEAPKRRRRRRRRPRSAPLRDPK